jgi:hypothetical protein
MSSGPPAQATNAMCDFLQLGFWQDRHHKRFFVLPTTAGMGNRFLPFWDDYKNWAVDRAGNGQFIFLQITSHMTAIIHVLFTKRFSQMLLFFQHDSVVNSGNEYPNAHQDWIQCVSG